MTCYGTFIFSLKKKFYKKNHFTKILHCFIKFHGNEEHPFNDLKRNFQLKIHDHIFVSSLAKYTDKYFISNFYFDVSFLSEAGD